MTLFAMHHAYSRAWRLLSIALAHRAEDATISPSGGTPIRATVVANTGVTLFIFSDTRGHGLLF